MKLIIQEKNNYLLRFDSGEELLSLLKEFLKKEKIFGAVFFGLGAAKEIEFSFFDPKKKKYFSKKKKGQFEIANLVGNVATLEKEILIHAHITFGDKKGKTFCGHLKSLIVFPTFELYLKKFKKKIFRKFSPKINLNLLD